MSESNDNVQPLSDEQMQQLAEDPSLLLDNPELEASLDASLQAAESPTPQEPAPEAPPSETPAPPDGTPAPAAPQVPAYLADIPEADRKTVLESWISSLKPEERASLAPVKELLDGVAANATQRGAESASRQNVEQAQRQQLEIAATTLVDRLRPLVGDQMDVNREVNNIVDHAQSQIATQVTQGLQAIMRQGGINQVPPAVLDAASKAQNAYEATAIYASFLARTAYTQGMAAGESKAKQGSQRDAKAEEAVWRQKHLAELQKEGRLRDNTPPAISSGSPATGGGALTEEEWERFQRLTLEDPTKIPDDLMKKAERAFASNGAR